MKMEGRQNFAAGVELLWTLLNDPLALQQILPGCEALEAVAAAEYRVALALRVGAVTERFEGILLLERLVPFTRFDFRAEGESPSGLVSCQGRVSLEERAGNGSDRGSDRHSTLCYEAEIDVGGRLTAVSGRLLETTARAFARRTLEGLERQVAMRTRTYTSTLDTPTPAAPTPDAPHWLPIGRGAAVLLGALLALFLLLRELDRRRTRRIAHEVVDLLEQAHAPESGAG
jgi:carbon monoxide dehydrogenase subunit G